MSKEAKKIRSIAIHVRELVSDMASYGQSDRYENNYIAKRDLNGLCLYASIILKNTLLYYGYGNLKPIIATGVGHAFVICNGYIVDVTASQFGQPKVVVRDINAVKKIIETGEISLKFWNSKDGQTNFNVTEKSVLKDVVEMLKSPLFKRHRRYFLPTLCRYM